MWSVYLKSNEGIAIQSTVQRLCDCFKNCDDTVYIGKVFYKDYNKEIIEDSSVFGNITHKRKSYEYENEVRAVISEQSNEDNIPYHDIGKSVPVGLETLVENIFIAPNSPDWYSDLVVEVTKQFGFSFTILKSDLNDTSLH